MFRSSMTIIRELYLYVTFFLSNAITCPCGLRDPPSWAWQECNRRLRLGRP